MRPWLDSRVGHYALLIGIVALLTLPNLGGPSLWDVDEGVNAEAAREMREAETWIIPTFNFELRTAKPVMLYWLQRFSYAAFGVSEWSARLPSMLAALGTVLLAYELARRMFGRTTGLLAGVVLASAIEFCVLAHAATPDATLLFFTMLTYTVFWFGQENGSRSWWMPTAAACGLAFLTKGPVGVALPGLVVFLFFLWNRELSRLWDRRLIHGLLVGVLVAAPWYAWVAMETRGQWPKAFFLNENVNRALSPMENHRGPVVYHAVALLALFAPWSIFIGATLWYGVQGTRRNATSDPVSSPLVATSEPAPFFRAHRFLICWFGGYLVFFSLMATKLPNYVLPLYPALAILTARFLTRWQERSLAVPRWIMPAGIAGMVLVAAGIGGGLLVAGGKVSVPVGNMRIFPGLETWAVLAVVPLIGAVLLAVKLRKDDRDGFIRVAGAVSIVLVAFAIFPASEMDRYKAPRDLVRESGAGDPTRDIRVASFAWFQPSVVFYAQREVQKLTAPEKAVEFLATPSPGFLFVPEKTWNDLAPTMNVPYRVAAKHYDFYTNNVVLVVSNEDGPRLAWK